MPERSPLIKYGPARRRRADLVIRRALHARRQALASARGQLSTSPPPSDAGKPRSPFSLSRGPVTPRRRRFLKPGRDRGYFQQIRVEGTRRFLLGTIRFAVDWNAAWLWRLNRCGIFRGSRLLRFERTNGVENISNIIVCD